MCSSDLADRLQEARRLLEQERSGQAGRDIQSIQEQQRRLADAERQVQQQVDRLGEGRAGRDSAQRQLQQQKNQMAGEVRSLTAQLDRLATEQAREQPGASRSMRDAADSLRGSRLADRLQTSGQAVATAPPQWLREMEQQFGQEIDRLGKQIGRAHV